MIPSFLVSLGKVLFGLFLGITKGREFGIIWLVGGAALIGTLVYNVCVYYFDMTLAVDPFGVILLTMSGAAAGSFLALLLIDGVVYVMSLIVITLLVFILYSMLWSLEPESEWTQVRVTSSVLIGLLGSFSSVKFSDLSVNASCIIMGSFMVSLGVQDVLSMLVDSHSDSDGLMCLLGRSVKCYPMYGVWFLSLFMIFWLRLSRRRVNRQRQTELLSEPLIEEKITDSDWRPHLPPWLHDLGVSLRLIFYRFLPTCCCSCFRCLKMHRERQQTDLPSSDRQFNQ